MHPIRTYVIQVEGLTMLVFRWRRLPLRLTFRPVAVLKPKLAPPPPREWGWFRLPGRLYLRSFSAFKFIADL